MLLITSIMDDMMISYNYRINEFLDAVKEKDFIEIIRLAEAEVEAAEYGLSGVKGAKAKRASGAPEYAALLKGFLFFMKNGIKPYGVDDEYFQLFRPVVTNLVEKKLFKPGILNAFSSQTN